MTVEERAQELWKALAWLTDDEMLSDSQRGQGTASIERYLRDQIEECAKKADDRVAQYKAEGNLTFMWLFKHCANDIHALAGPIEERKETNADDR